MGRPTRWMNELTGLGAMRSPGALLHRREIERRFWEKVATGITSEKAAVEMATLEWVAWFNNQRLLSSIVCIPPAEAEKNYYRQKQCEVLESEAL